MAVSQEQKRYKISLICTAVIIGFILFIQFGIPALGNLGRTNSEDKMMQDVYAFAKDTAKSHLKAPSTAIFPSYDSEDVVIDYIADGSYMVAGWVDSQNTFGAMIRSKYAVHIAKTDEGFKVNSFAAE